MPTDAKGEYRLNQYGSKERPGNEEKTVWLLYSDDMSQAEIDARAAQKAVQDQEKAQREADAAYEEKIKSQGRYDCLTKLKSTKALTDPEEAKADAELVALADTIKPVKP